MYNTRSDAKVDPRAQRRIFILEDEGNADVKEIDYDQGNELGFRHHAYDQYKRHSNHCDRAVNITNRNHVEDNTISTFRRKIANPRTKSNEESNPPPVNLKDLTSSFFKKSSIYALNQIGNSNTTRRKIFWAFIFIGGIIGCCSQVYKYLSAYYQYPVVINIDSINLFNQEFPGVTVCNLNNVRSQYFPCVLMKQDYEDCKTPDESWVPPSLKDAVNWNQPDCFEQLDAKLSEEFMERMQFLSLMFSLKEKSKITYAHQAVDFIKSCSFNGEECSHTDFTIHLDRMYGNCFTFNKANDSKSPFKTSFIGPNSGLTLELDIQSQEYVWLTQAVGARVVIHDPYQEPSPQDEGLNVSPGFETTLGLSKSMMRRMPYPYKDNCKSYKRNESKKICDSVCTQKKISHYCSCSIPSTTLVAERYCDLTNVTELCCLYRGKMEDNLETYNETCYCPLECETPQYDIKISSGVWPAYPSNLGVEYSSHPIEEIRETLIKVKIYFDTLERLTYEQKAMFEESEVLSQVGGQMGLWLGLSLAAMFECLENIVLFWHYRNKQPNDVFPQNN